MTRREEQEDWVEKNKREDRKEESSHSREIPDSWGWGVGGGVGRWRGKTSDIPSLSSGLSQGYTELSVIARDIF